MAMYELFNEAGDTGLLVVGTTVDQTFRAQADAVGRADERLLTVESTKELLDPQALHIAAQGLAKTLVS
jgi:hypothetical protein